MQLSDYLPFRLTRLSARVAEAVSQVHAKRFGLSRDEWRVLSAVGEREAQPTREVTEATGLDKVAISRAASSLEDRGLIRRSEDRGDRRIKILRLTAEGAALLEDLERVMRARETYLLDGLTETERDMLTVLIAKLETRAETLAAPETAHRCRPDCSGACERTTAMFGLADPHPLGDAGADRRLRAMALQ